MTYQKPELVLNGTAIGAIEAGLDKDIEVHDGSPTVGFSPAAYRSDE